MQVTFMKEMTVFWSFTMALKLLAVLSVLATANGWQYDGGDNGSSDSLPEGGICRIKTGEPGICTRLTSCAVYYEALRQKTIKYSFLVRCSFIDTEEVICCPSDVTSVNPVPTTEQISTSWEKPIGTTKARTTTTTTTTTTTMQPIVVGDKTLTGSDDSNVRPNRVWDWSAQNTERTVRTTTRRTTTTTTTETSGLTNWMIDALSQAITTTTPTPPVTAIPFTTTPRTTSSSTTAETVTNRNNGNERPAEAACRRYSGGNPAGLTFHILDGVPVAPGEFPHMGGLIYPVGGGTDVDNRCGSSLISERYVLTAAHCVNDPLSLPTFVRLGVVVWNSTDDSILPVDVEIENITLHPEYLSHLRYHDVALIRLRNDVEFTPFIRPACLYSDMKDIDSGTLLVVIGWGVTNVQTRARSQVLLMTNVTTVALQDCNATHIAYGTSRSYRTGLNPGHYCAFDPELKKDACQSDSGGPLQLVRNKESSIVGIVSFGLSCGSSVPSVYARVAYYLDWIESIVWPS